MMFLWLGMLTILFLFGVVLIFGAPYLPTLRAQQEKALDLLDLKPGQQFYDLGCGDGRLLMAAAKRGLMATGVEMNLLLVIVAKLYTLKYRKNVKVIWGNFWRTDIKNADGIFVFLIKHKMARLDEHIQSNASKKLKVVSYGFEIPGKKPAKNENPLFLYTYAPLVQQ